MNAPTDNPSFFQSQELIDDYFPHLDDLQQRKFKALGTLYKAWNSRINIISRADMAYLYPRHVLPSLAVAKLLTFQKGAEVLDLGTGGGFPGIPLAILFPDTHFYLVDSIHKKIRVVADIAQSLDLGNVTPLCRRAERLEGRYDFVLSRAVASLPKLLTWTHGKIKPSHTHAIANGLLCWKGGDLTQELTPFSPLLYHIYPLQALIPYPSWEGKVIVHLYDEAKVLTQ